MEASKSPNVRVIETTVPAQATAGTPQDQVVGEAPFAGTVTAVKIVPEANLTANATNYRTFRLINKGQDGNGTTVVATFATDTVTVDDLADFDERVVPLSVVAGAATVAAGDVLAMDETVTGTGVAHSGYRAIVEVSRS